jgi:uncharacterized membrane protein (DUF485 family)
MTPITPELTREILSDSSFRELVSTRARLRWALSIVTLAMFFGFIALISSASAMLGTNMTGSKIPFGIGLAFGIIVLVVILTGFYVRQSNTRFDRLVSLIKQEYGQ